MASSKNSDFSTILSDYTDKKSLLAEAKLSCRIFQVFDWTAPREHSALAELMRVTQVFESEIRLSQ